MEGQSMLRQFDMLTGTKLSSQQLKANSQMLKAKMSPNGRLFSIIIENIKSLYLHMQIEEAKDKFVQMWGTLSSSWGINRTMAQIHSLLLISPDPLCTEDLMEQLNISRGNANMNIRALIDWRLVQKEHRAGDRKEYFVAEKDIWEITRRIMAERKRREIEPVIKVLEQVQDVEGDPNDPKIKAFRESVANMKKFVIQIDGISDKFLKTEQGFIFNALLKLFK